MPTFPKKDKNKTKNFARTNGKITTKLTEGILGSKGDLSFYK